MLGCLRGGSQITLIYWANVGAMWTRWPKVGNLNPSNLTLLVGSMWDQHDDCTSANVCGLKSVSLSRNTHVCVILFV